jgi:hypothetical protein
VLYGSPIHIQRCRCRGQAADLQVDPATLTYIEKRSVEVHVAETGEAVRIYNKLADTVPVAGLFHSTC